MKDLFWRNLTKTVSALMVAIWALASPCATRAETALVAVAANFAEVMEQLEEVFETTHEHSITVSVGSTGRLYAQIINGAPFDLFLSADQARPDQIISQAFADPEDRYTYAFGQLALWSADKGRVPEQGQKILQTPVFRKLAIANPALAPYGKAAWQTLERLGVYHSLKDKIVYGENIGQAYAFIASGNAELGLIALSLVISARNANRGSVWKVPANLYDPIRQDAVLLKRGKDNQAATAFLIFLKSATSRSIIRQFGYRVD